MNRPEKQGTADVRFLVQSVDAALRVHRLLEVGQNVLVAVSGGVDSMVLLDVLRRLSEEFQWQLHLAHFNHRLRGRSSDADEKLVRRTAQTLNIPISVESTDVRKFSRTQKISIEMAARHLRHGFFVRVARDQKIQTITLAHHADDQVELFFVRLLRGSGPAGLAGMHWSGPSPADPNLRLVRPLLDCTKHQLLEYARSEKLKFREDGTNQTLDILRNRIRHELLPLLRKRYQPALQKTTLRLMDVLRAESKLLDSMEPLTQALAAERERRPVAEFSALHMALQRRLVQKQLIELGVQPNFELIEDLRQNADAPVMIDPERVLRRDAAGRVSVEGVAQPLFDAESLVVSFSSRCGIVSFAGVAVDWRIEPIATPLLKSLKPMPGVESFDADKVGASIELRHWRPGDRFQPIGMSKPVKLQDLFVNQKISRSERHKLLLAATSAGDIVWVERLRISERFKLDCHSQRQLKWRWRRE